MHNTVVCILFCRQAGEVKIASVLDDGSAMAKFQSMMQLQVRVEIKKKKVERGAVMPSIPLSNPKNVLVFII